MKKTVFIIIIFLQHYSIFCQESCGTDKYHEDLFAAHPEEKKAYLEAEAQLLYGDIQQYLKRTGSNTTTIYEIPVVVHLMNDGTKPLRTDAEIIKWIDNCNKYYDNTFGGEWYTTAQGGTIIPFKLVLAKRTPSCQSTTGIVQVNVTATYPQYATKGCNYTKKDGVEDFQLRGLSRWEPQAYYNIYVVNTFDSTPVNQVSGFQGYAGFPSLSDAFYDTFIKAPAVISSANMSTLSHEFGHAMGIHHPFNNGGSDTSCPTVSAGGCTKDNDLVCDTPATKSLLGVPSPSNESVNPCDAEGWKNVQYNTMNYTVSKRLFTPGQRDRGIGLFLFSRSNLTKSLGATPIVGSTTAVVATVCIEPTNPINRGDLQYGPTKVILGTINNSSQGSNSSNSNKVFYDYTQNSCLSSAFKTNLDVSSNPQNLILRCSTATNIFSAWIDYNNNGFFETSELIVADKSVPFGIDRSFKFSIPTSGVILNTPLRMRVIADSVNSSTAPCGRRTDGQIEDYEVTIIDSALSLEKFDFAKLKIYPNPTRSNLSIEFDKIIEEITVTNILGQTVFSKNINESKAVIDLSSLTSGTYFVKVSSGGNSRITKVMRE